MGLSSHIISKCFIDKPPVCQLTKARGRDELDWGVIVARVFKSEPSSLTQVMLGAGMPDAVHETLNGSLSNMVVSLTGCVCICGGTVCVCVLRVRNNDCLNFVDQFELNLW